MCCAGVVVCVCSFVLFCVLLFAASVLCKCDVRCCVCLSCVCVVLVFVRVVVVLGYVLKCFSIMGCDPQPVQQAKCNVRTLRPACWCLFSNIL